MNDKKADEWYSCVECWPNLICNSLSKYFVSILTKSDQRLPVLFLRILQIIQQDFRIFSFWKFRLKYPAFGNFKLIYILQVHEFVQSTNSSQHRLKINSKQYAPFYLYLLRGICFTSVDRKFGCSINNHSIARTNKTHSLIAKDVFSYNF